MSPVLDAGALMLAYLIILTTIVCGLIGLPWWTAMVGGAVLTMPGIAEQLKYRSRFVAIDATDSFVGFVLAHVGTAQVVCVVAYLFGRVLSAF